MYNLKINYYNMNQTGFLKEDMLFDRERKESFEPKKEEDSEGENQKIPLMRKGTSFMNVM